MRTVLIVFFLGIQSFASAQAATDRPFTAALKELSVSNTQAGAPVDLTVHMKRLAMDHCTKPDVNPSGVPVCLELYLEQHLKRLRITLPQGATPDPQAAPYCGVNFVKDVEVIGVIFTRDGWICTNPKSRVGSVDISSTACGDSLFFASFAGCFDDVVPGVPPFTVPPGVAIHEPGIVYNEKPGPDEQGHLVILWPKLNDYPGYMSPFYIDASSPAIVKSDVSITYDKKTGKVIADGDNIPDKAELLPPLPGFKLGELPAGIFDMKMKLDGDTGVENGHPLLTNSGLCTPQQTDVLFQGYLFQANLNPGGNDPVTGDPFPGHGDGKTVTATAPYQTTGCELVPYAPKLDFTLDKKTPGAVPGISTTITQASPASPQFIDEQTSSKIEVNFPKGFGVNIKSKVSPCLKTAVADGTCPASAKLGTMSAESRLLPPGQSLNGDVYLTEAQGSSFGISTQLSGSLQPGTKPIKIMINGTAKVFAQGGIDVSFTDLPALPIKKLDLSLSGGISQGLIKTPQICDKYPINTIFTSHSGRKVTTSPTVQIKDCGESSFDVDLTENGAGKKTAVQLDMSSPGKPIEKLSFGLDRGYRPSLKGLGKRKKVATISVGSASGLKQVSLKRAKKKKKAKKALKLTGGSALGNLSANIFRKRFTRSANKVFKRPKNKKNKKLKTKTVIKNRVTLKSLPQDDVTRVSVSLNPAETAYLKNPRCKGKRKLNFVALITTTDGAKHAISRKVKLRCSKSSKSR